MLLDVCVELLDAVPVCDAEGVPEPVLDTVGVRVGDAVRVAVTLLDSVKELEAEVVAVADADSLRERVPELESDDVGELVRVEVALAVSLGVALSELVAELDAVAVGV